MHPFLSYDEPKHLFSPEEERHSGEMILKNSANGERVELWWRKPFWMNSSYSISRRRRRRESIPSQKYAILDLDFDETNRQLDAVILRKRRIPSNGRLTIAQGIENELLAKGMELGAQSVSADIPS